MNNTKRNKITISTLCLLLLSLLLITTTLQITQSTPSTSIKNTIITPNPSIDLYSDFWESAWTWVDHDGWLNARAEINSKDLGFGEQNLNLFIASYKDIYNTFDHANWWFWRTNDPGDQNTEVEIHFRTNDATLAKEYADLIVNYMSKGLMINYEYEGTWAWEDWRGDPGEWTDLTAVRYRSHIVWPWFTEFINNEIIPRNIGGLAETINVTEANNINAWAWPQGDGSIGFAFGFEFNYNIYDISGYYSGPHTITLNDLIHTEKIQVNNYQDHLWLNFALPDVTSLISTPSTNTSACYIYRKYHPPPEPWVTHHYWDVDFEIHSGVYTDLSVSFSYNFVPQYLQSRIEASITVNHYGYLQKDIYLQGDYSRVIDFESPTVTTHWDPNIGIMEMYFRPNTYGLTNNTFDLTIVYNDTADHYNNANDIAMDIETYLGIDFTNNHTEYNWWDWNRLRYEGNTYRFHAEDFTPGISQNLLSSSDVISSSPVFESQDTTTSEYHQFSYYHPEVAQWIDEIDFRWNPLAEEVANPTKTYTGSYVNENIDLLSEWSWSSFPYCSNYSVSRFPIVVPYDAYTVYPRENNGWGWHINTWEEQWFHNIRYVHHNLEIYTDAASLEFVDNNGNPNGTVLSQFGLKLDYTFLGDDVDTQPPSGNFYYHNFTATPDEEYWGNDIQNQGVTFSNVDNHLHVRVWDDNSHGIHSFWWPYYYWNGAYWEPRFGSSGIKETTVKAYFADLPAVVAQFERELSVTVWWENYPTIDYNVTWDTTDGFADGEWTLIAQTEDNDGNWMDFGIYNLVVDNYDEATTAEPVIDLLTAENEPVYGTHKIQIEVTDDVGVFAVVLTRDFTAFLLNDTNSDDIYEFDWNTLGTVENSVHYFTITVWDMDGHKVIYDFWLKVDNIRPGNPPTVEIISPATEGKTLSGLYTFQVEVIDDLGIESVKMQIDQGATYTMTYNAATGYYEREHDLTKEINGDRILKIFVVDVDENQHTIYKTIGFTVVGGQEGPTVSDPPEWSSSRSNLPENLSDYVEAGNLNDYEPVSGDIYFKVAVKDDLELTTVDFTVYIIDDFNPNTGEPYLGNIVEDITMGYTGSEAGWHIFEHSWDSTDVADGYYLCEIDVQDNDTVVNHLYIRIALQVDNVEGEEAPAIGGAPGFEFATLIFSLTSVYLVTTLAKRRRNK